MWNSRPRPPPPAPPPPWALSAIGASASSWTRTSSVRRGNGGLLLGRTWRHAMRQEVRRPPHEPHPHRERGEPEQRRAEARHRQHGERPREASTDEGTDPQARVRSPPREQRRDEPAQNDEEMREPAWHDPPAPRRPYRLRARATTAGAPAMPSTWRAWVRRAGRKLAAAPVARTISASSARCDIPAATCRDTIRNTTTAAAVSTPIWVPPTITVRKSERSDAVAVTVADMLPQSLDAE